MKFRATQKTGNCCKTAYLQRWSNKNKAPRQWFAHKCVLYSR